MTGILYSQEYFCVIVDLKESDLDNKKSCLVYGLGFAAG